MPVDEAQLATQRQYIRNNPRSRMMRTLNRSWLQPQRHAVNTAVSIPALKGYLQRECPRQLTAEGFASLSERLLLEDGMVTLTFVNSNTARVKSEGYLGLGMNINLDGTYSRSR